MEDRILRSRIQQLSDAVDNARIQQIDAGISFLGQTAHDNTQDATSYPTLIGSVFLIQALAIDSTSIEASSPTFSNDNDGVLIPAVHIGVLVPPLGLRVICSSVGGQWCFTYNG